MLLQAGEAEKNATITTLRQKLKTVKTKLDNKKLEAQAMEIMIEDLQESLREAEAKSAETKSLAEKVWEWYSLYSGRPAFDFIFPRRWSSSSPG